MRDPQAGSIVWVSGATIFWTALLYGAIGLFHFVFRRRFCAISMDPEGAEAGGLNVLFRDFLFYVPFGFVVTSSVSIAGVLLVFSYLVIPSVVAFGLFLVLAGVVHFVLASAQRGRALLRVAGIAALFFGFLRGTLLFEHRRELDLGHVLESGTKAEQLVALSRLEADRDRRRAPRAWWTQHREEAGRLHPTAPPADGAGSEGRG